MCVIFHLWQAKPCLEGSPCAVYGSESPSYGLLALNHVAREGAVPSRVGGLDGPLANVILPFKECTVKFPALLAIHGFHAIF